MTLTFSSEKLKTSDLGGLGYLSSGMEPGLNFVSLCPGCATSAWPRKESVSVATQG
jgi:hypothetical protein